MKENVIHITERGCYNCRLHYVNHKKCDSEYPCKVGGEWRPIVQDQENDHPFITKLKEKGLLLDGCSMDRINEICDKVEAEIKITTEERCHKIYQKVKEANTPDHRSFEAAEGINHLRIIMKLISSRIDIDNEMSVSDFKALWNSLSDIITKLDFAQSTQPVPEITDEEIEKEFPTDLKTLCELHDIPLRFDADQGFYLDNLRGDNIAKQQGAKWMRDKIKQNE